MKLNKLINLGTRNKGTFWEYLSAYSFLHAKFLGSKFRFDFFAGVGRGIANKHCHSQEDLDRNTGVFIEEFPKNFYTRTYFKKLRNFYLNGLTSSKKIGKINNFENLDNKRLINLFNKAWRNASVPNSAMLQALYATCLNDFFKEEFFKVLSDKEKKNLVFVNNLQSLLLTKIKFSITDKEEQSLYNLKSIYKRKYSKKGLKEFFDNLDIVKSIKKIVKDFAWFHMEYSADPFTFQDYKEHIRKELSKDNNKKSPRENIKEVISQKNAFFAKHKNSVKLKSLTGILEEFAFILEESKAVVVENFFVCWPLYLEIAKRLGVHYKDMFLLTPPEIASYLKNSKLANKELIKKRKKARMVVLKDKKITWGEGKKVDVFEKKYLPKKENVKKSKEVKGIVAYPGIVKGRAVLVKSIKDHKRFKPGDIMIAHDGSAELTIILKEAGAIVTNEGGIICHTATVAREFKTPCIVGTKIVTKIIKDGDIVEVNADKGIIKKLN